MTTTTITERRRLTVLHAARLFDGTGSTLLADPMVHSESDRHARRGVEAPDSSGYGPPGYRGAGTSPGARCPAQRAPTRKPPLSGFLRCSA